jgi:glyoxylase-like metal-dependent hydrolase (beta-lactamase superfamily II)
VQAPGAAVMRPPLSSSSVANDCAITPAGGHTPGHFMVIIEGERNAAILCGDLMHHPLQLRHPEWSTRFCVDPAQARATRRLFLADHADSDRLVFPAHFPTPVGGRILRQRDHYRFQFCDAPN